MQRSLSMDLTFRRAEDNDLWRIVDLLGEDTLGSQREHTVDHVRRAVQGAYDAIAADPRQLLVVAETGGEVVGTLQLSFIQYLTYTGGERAQIEAVRVALSLRGRGVGRRMIEWAIGKAQAEGCHLVQLDCGPCPVLTATVLEHLLHSSDPHQPLRGVTGRSDDPPVDLPIAVARWFDARSAGRVPRTPPEPTGRAAQPPRPDRAGICTWGRRRRSGRDGRAAHPAAHRTAPESRPGETGHPRRWPGRERHGRRA